MAEEKKQALEREYIIPLRREFLKLPQYRRAGRAAKAVKKFIAKHMKVADRDMDKVKLDVYLNHEIWFRGKRNPLSKIKVKAIKEGEIVRVVLAEMPEVLKFMKARHEKVHKLAEKLEKKAEVKPAEESKDEKAQDAAKKEDEKEKAKAGEAEKLKETKQEARTEKHIAKAKEPEIHRRAMNRH
jgi:large subunit ribosomal protein L31e